jgi:hypothetical protein
MYAYTIHNVTSYVRSDPAKQYTASHTLKVHLHMYDTLTRMIISRICDRKNNPCTSQKQNVQYTCMHALTYVWIHAIMLFLSLFSSFPHTDLLLLLVALTFPLFAVQDFRLRPALSQDSENWERHRRIFVCSCVFGSTANPYAMKFFSCRRRGCYFLGHAPGSW